ncbi:MAG: [acyl-carrier-protein] S-malonyltransferase [Geminicoccaceae bacterium]|nr:MAG: [acyl-carrier-protein] S-malonyltransferase [Geminicoccaceae bacterium]
MVTAFLFPGQGSQKVGMGADLAAAFPEARAVLEAVDDALGEKLSTLMAEGPESTLMLTANTQPALMAVSLAAIRALEAAIGRRFADLAGVAAGHSLGEYAALTAAGTFELADAARLLRLRGAAMQAAVPPGEGAMAAILGLGLGECEFAAAAADGIVDVANDNADGQVVLSGGADAVARAVELAKQAGAKRALPLAVSAPFHCRLMQPAAERMAEALAAVTMRDPVIPIVANVSAAPVTTAAAVREALIAQVCARVRWRETMAELAAMNTTEVVEAGSGKVLAGLAKRSVPNATIANLETAADVRALAERLA